MNAPAANPTRRHPAVIALFVIVAAEALLLAVATAWLAIELVVDTPASPASAGALTVTTAVLAVGVAWLAIGILRRRRVRGGIVVWQILQAAVGIGALQGVFARPDLGWALLAPAIAGFVLVLTPPVTAELAQPARDA